MDKHSNNRIIIIGAGFAGLHLARQLSNSPFDVVLIDRFNYHQFQPLFYQVATARVEPSSISFPLRKIFQGKKNIHIRLAEVKGIKEQENKVVAAGGEGSTNMVSWLLQQAVPPIFSIMKKLNRSLSR